MNVALLLTAGHETCPQPQTSEPLVAIEIVKLMHILILENKIDLVKESLAKEQCGQTLALVYKERQQKELLFSSFCSAELQY